LPRGPFGAALCSIAHAIGLMSGARRPFLFAPGRSDFARPFPTCPEDFFEKIVVENPF
jgi:hypothetical protein